MLSKLPKALTKKDKILKDLFRIEMDFISEKLGFSQSCKRLDEKQIILTLKYIDVITSTQEDVDKNYIIAVLALLWEHSDHQLFDLRPAILRFLARIGYTTTAIAVDEEYDSTRGAFSFVNSILDQISTSLFQATYEYSINRTKYFLTEFQKSVIESIDSNKYVGVSAPTSAGKTYSIILKTFELLIKNDYELIYIVPTLSLQNQIIENYTRLFREHSYTRYFISSIYQAHNNDIPCVFVLTQEKALAALSFSTSYSRSLILVIDEIQNIEHVSKEENGRSRVLLDMINEFRHMKTVKKVILSGPRIEDIGALGTCLFGRNTFECTTSVSPVLNITYSIRKSDGNYFFVQHNPLLKKAIERKIDDPQKVCNYGKVQYGSAFTDYLYNFVARIGEGQQNIVFAPNSTTARTIALAFAEKQEEVTNNRLLCELSEYYRNSVHKCYSLSKTVLHGVAYHHGKVPTHVRRTLERAISDKLILNVVCTTTLMQGVNLPAQNVIMRNPNLYINKKKNSSKLTNYEIANLRGRAGRLMKDLVGRTYVLDEGQFEKEEDSLLFEEVTKQLSPTYNAKFELFKDNIEEVILTSESVDKSMEEFGYLAIFIRQSLLRYGVSAKERLEELGIFLKDEVIETGLGKLEELTIPLEACKKNRYWDPFVLEEIYREFSGHIPRSPLDKDSINDLRDMLTFLRESPSTSSIFADSVPNKYLSGTQFSILCDYCIKWARGMKLSGILDSKFCNDEDSQDRIDDIINLIQNVVSYKIPLIIKPIFDMNEDDGAFVKSLQNGTCDFYTIKLIEMGIPRETALELSEDYLDMSTILKDTEEDIEEELRDRIREIKIQLPYWVRVQVEHI